MSTTSGAPGAAADLADALRALRERADMPSTRRLADRIGTVSHTTIAEAFSGRRVPSWPVTEALVDALGGDKETFRQLWAAAADAASSDPSKQGGAFTVMESVPYHCFISYTRADNNDFDGVVDRLKRELAGKFEAATGSQLTIFLDRDSIGWGERWRDKITEAIGSSTLFVPIVTMRYFNSPACRDELSAFYSAAAQKGVTDLILPIVLAGADQITSDNQDELVRAVASLNYQPIFEEFEAGYGSSEWKRRISKLVSGLRKALDQAASRLSVATEEHTASTYEVIEDTDPQIIEERISTLTAQLYAIQAPIEQAGAAVQNRLEGKTLSRMTAGQRTFLYGALAEDLREPATEFGATASAMEATARTLDAELRALATEMYVLDPQEAQKQLTLFREAIRSQFSSISAFLDQVAQLEQGLRMAALASVALRKALAPMTSGLRSLNTTMKIISSLDSIGLT